MLILRTRKYKISIVVGLAVYHIQLPHNYIQLLRSQKRKLIVNIKKKVYQKVVFFLEPTLHDNLTPGSMIIGIGVLPIVVVDSLCPIVPFAHTQLYQRIYALPAIEQKKMTLSNILDSI